MNLSATLRSPDFYANVAWLLCAVAWWFAPRAFLPAYLAVWWFCMGIAMGGLANVWVHNLTGGAWGEAIRGPLLEMGRVVWVGSLLFLPVLVALPYLYPWAVNPASGVARWAGELAPGPAQFKSAWLMPGFFVARSVVYLAIWSVLGWLSNRPSLCRSPAFSSAALIVYAISVSMAAFDWLMSLMPLWYSSIFGLVAGIGQMMSGMAMAVVLAAWLPRSASQRPSHSVFHDLGNLMLTYVLLWTYLAFMQFLIIWAEDLPHEIAWYVPRLQSGWVVVAWMLVLLLFFGPLLILLSRNFKRTPKWLARLAAALLVMLLVDACWMVLPSTPVDSVQWLWAVPLSAIALGLAAWAMWRRQYRLHPPGDMDNKQEKSHA